MLVTMNTPSWTVKQAALIYGKSDQTIRNWSIEFAEYLSISANPGGDRNREFTSDDMAVLDYIAVSKKHGSEYNDIRAGLANGERGQVPQVSPDTINALALTQQEQALQAQVDYQLKVIELLNEQVKTLSEKIDNLSPLHDENIKLRTDKEHLERRIAELENRLEVEYQRGLSQGKAEGELAALRETIKKKKR